MFLVSIFNVSFFSIVGASEHSELAPYQVSMITIMMMMITIIIIIIIIIIIRITMVRNL